MICRCGAVDPHGHIVLDLSAAHWNKLPNRKAKASVARWLRSVAKQLTEETGIRVRAGGPPKPTK